jgi:ribosomal protein S18 acetylase RimI-like enzyme
VVIRRATPDDREAVYSICLRTGDGGADATALYRDPDLLGHVWAGAYLALEPDLAFVVEDDAGPAGYVLGALDTAAFEARCEADWWPPLRELYPDPVGIHPSERNPDQQQHHLIHHPRRTPDQLTHEYPSHLHIDLLPRTQGRGDGRRLLSALLDALQGNGSRGVHLGTGVTNQRAIGFYQHLGFSRLPGSRDDTVLMGKRLC